MHSRTHVRTLAQAFTSLHADSSRAVRTTSSRRSPVRSAGAPWRMAHGWEPCLTWLGRTGVRQWQGWCWSPIEKIAGYKLSESAPPLSGSAQRAAVAPPPCLSPPINSSLAPALCISLLPPLAFVLWTDGFRAARNGRQRMFPGCTICLRRRSVAGIALGSGESAGSTCSNSGTSLWSWGGCSARVR